MERSLVLSFKTSMLSREASAALVADYGMRAILAALAGLTGRFVLFLPKDNVLCFTREIMEPFSAFNLTIKGFQSLPINDPRRDRVIGVFDKHFDGGRLAFVLDAKRGVALFANGEEWSFGILVVDKRSTTSVRGLVAPRLPFGQVTFSEEYADIIRRLCIKADERIA